MKYKIGQKVKLSAGGLDATLSDLYSESYEGDRTETSVERIRAELEKGEPVTISGIEPLDQNEQGYVLKYKKHDLPGVHPEEDLTPA